MSIKRTKSRSLSRGSRSHQTSGEAAWLMARGIPSGVANSMEFFIPHYRAEIPPLQILAECKEVRWGINCP